MTVRTNSLCLWGLLIGYSVNGWFSSEPLVAQERPNIVFFFSDDLTTQEMHNLAHDPQQAAKLKKMQARFEQTRKFYGDTDESVWSGGNREQYPPEAYIVPPRRR